MKFIKKKTVVEDGIIISFSFKFTKREIMGSQNINTDKNPTTIPDLMKMDDPEIFLAFLRIYVFWIWVFNSKNPVRRKKKRRKQCRLQTKT